MKRHLRILLAGALVVVPFAITLYIVWSAAGWLGETGTKLLGGKALGSLEQILPKGMIYPLDDQGNYLYRLDSAGNKVREVGWFVKLLGAVVIVLVIYLVGLLTHWWVFRKLLSYVEKWISRVPGIKTIYESVRDLMKLFGGDASRMGRAVLYRVPQSGISVLGILTNDNPTSLGPKGEKKVAVYLPFSYMFGGPTIYVSPDSVQDAGISVDQALKLCATAHVSQQAGEEAPAAQPADAAAVRAIAREVHDE